MAGCRAPSESPNEDSHERRVFVGVKEGFGEPRFFEKWDCHLGGYAARGRARTAGKRMASHRSSGGLGDRSSAPSRITPQLGGLGPVNRHLAK